MLSDHLIEESFGFLRTKPGDRHRRDMGPCSPGGCKFGPKSRNEQHGKRDNRFDELAKQFEAGRIDPMQILEYHENRSGAR